MEQANVSASKRVPVSHRHGGKRLRLHASFEQGFLPPHETPADEKASDCDRQADDTDRSGDALHRVSENVAANTEQRRPDNTAGRVENEEGSPGITVNASEERGEDA